MCVLFHSYESMKQLCDKYNKAITNIRKLVIIVVVLSQCLVNHLGLCDEISTACIFVLCVNECNV